MPAMAARDEGDLELPAALLPVGREQALLAARIGHEGRLVDRRDVKRVAFAAEIARDRVAIFGEALWEGGAPEVDVLRIAVMEQVPDDCDAVLPRRAGERLQAGEIIAAASVDQRPAHRLARGMDAERREVAVILVDAAVVPGRGDLIEPLPVPVVACRALEAGKEEAAKHRQSNKGTLTGRGEARFRFR